MTEPARPEADRISESALQVALDAAESARGAGDLAGALTLARQAWAMSGQAPAAQRLRSGQVLARLAHQSGALAEMVDTALECLPLLRSLGPEAELFDLLRLVAMGASDLARFETALAAAQEAHRLAHALGDPARQSLAANALGCFFERIGDPWQAERLLLEALSLAEAAAEPHPRFVALNNLAAVLIGAYYLTRDGQPLDDARGALQRALPHAEQALLLARQSGNPFQLVFVQGNLGEILVHLGRLDDAESLLDAALATAIGAGFEAQVSRMRCSLGELRLLQDRHADAQALLEAVLQGGLSINAPITQMRVRHALWRTCKATGRADDALRHLEQYLLLERQRSLTQMAGQSQLFVTRVEAEQVRRDVEREQARSAALEIDARRDPLTGLGNRRELEQRWFTLRDSVAVTEAPLAVALIDLDHFKKTNDSFGHAIGDAVLVALARMLLENTRTDDVVTRIGGEEFLLLLVDTTPSRAAEVCERLRQRVAHHGWELLAPGLQVTISIGVACAPPLDLQVLSKRADEALYRAKRAGRNQVAKA